MAKIEIRTSPVAAGRRHAFFVFTKEDGSEYVVRAGPSQDPNYSNEVQAGANIVSQAFGAGDGGVYGSVKFEAMPYEPYEVVNVIGVGWIPKELAPIGAQVEADPYNKDQPLVKIANPPDWPQPGKVHERRVVWQGTDTEIVEKYKTLIAFGDQINLLAKNETGFEYNAWSNNSNTFVGVGCKVIEVPCSLPVGADGKEVSAPGFDAIFGQYADAFGSKSGITFDGKFWRDASGDVTLPPGFPRPDTPPEYDSSFNPDDPQYQEDWSGGIAAQGDNSPSPYTTNPPGAPATEQPVSSAPTPLEREIERTADRLTQRNSSEAPAAPADTSVQLAANEHADTMTEAPVLPADGQAQPAQTDSTTFVEENSPISSNVGAKEPGWAEANDYAQGVQSAVSFIQALQQGNEFSAALSGVSMLNAFSKATGHGQYFSNTTTAGLGAASAAMNLYDALKADDNLGALAAATNLGSQVATLYAANASTQAAAQAAGSWAQGLGTAAGILGIANSLKNGDEAGAALSALIAFGGPAGALVGTVLAIGRALRGPKEPPEVHGEAEVIWTENGNLDIRVSGDQNGGGERARSTLASLLVSVEGYLGKEQDAHGDPHFALIPQRLPSVIFHGQYESHLILRTRDEEGRPVERYYDGAGNRIGLDGSIESTFAEDFLDEVVEQNAIVPKWEADTVRQRMDHGDSNAWKDETLPTPEDVKGGLLALTFHIPGASSESAGTSARFDLNNDSYLDPVDWNGPYQAFLALDRDGNGLIDSGRELITFDGSPSPHPRPSPSFPLPPGEGGEPMRAERALIHSGEGEPVVARPAGSAHNSLQWLDANGDGILNAGDPAFTALRVWLDVNSNAHTEEGELATLAQLGITAIDFRENPPVIVDGEGNTQPLTPKHLLPKGEGARLATSEAGTDIQLADGYKASYLRAGDTRIVSAPLSPTVQEELARHTANMSREAQGLFGGHAALLTGLAVAQTAAAGNAMSPTYFSGIPLSGHTV